MPHGQMGGGLHGGTWVSCRLAHWQSGFLEHEMRVVLLLTCAAQTARISSTSVSYLPGKDIDTMTSNTVLR